MHDRHKPQGRCTECGAPTIRRTFRLCRRCHAIARADLGRPQSHDPGAVDPGELAADRWLETGGYGI